jgi:hypothetical protein
MSAEKKLLYYYLFNPEEKMSAGVPPEPTPQDSLNFATAIDPRTGYAYMDTRDMYDPRMFQPSGKKWDLNQPIDPVSSFLF